MPSGDLALAKEKEHIFHWPKEKGTDLLDVGAPPFTEARGLLCMYWFHSYFSWHSIVLFFYFDRLTIDVGSSHCPSVEVDLATPAPSFAPAAAADDELAARR